MLNRKTKVLQDKLFKTMEDMNILQEKYYAAIEEQERLQAALYNKDVIIGRLWNKLNEAKANPSKGA